MNVWLTVLRQISFDEQISDEKLAKMKFQEQTQKMKNENDVLSPYQMMPARL
jgi:hypothetical protein